MRSPTSVGGRESLSIRNHGEECIRGYQRKIQGQQLKSHPVLPFLVFLEKGTENPPKKQGFFIPTEPLKSLEKKGKTLEKTRNSSQGKKTRNSKKTRKGRTGQITRVAPVRFGSVTVWGWNGSSGSGFRFRRFLEGGGFCVFQYRLAERTVPVSGFGSWKTVPAVPVPSSVPGKTVPTVPVSGSGSVPGPPWKSFQNFSHFFTLSRTFFDFFPQDFPLQTKGFRSMRTKEKKR